MIHVNLQQRRALAWVRHMQHPLMTVSSRISRKMMAGRASTPPEAVTLAYDETLQHCASSFTTLEVELRIILGASVCVWVMTDDPTSTVTLRLNIILSVETTKNWNLLTDSIICTQFYRMFSTCLGFQHITGHVVCADITRITEKSHWDSLRESRFDTAGSRCPSESSWWWW